MKNLIVIDGNSLLFRAYYALPNMSSRDGVPTGALYGFLNMLFKLMEREPDYLVVAFDMHTPTFRHEAYDGYKAGRRETPEDLLRQMPLIRELLTKMGICVCECQRYEADDILGTLARRAAKDAMQTLLVSGDRDILQLVSNDIHVLLTKKGITETVEYDPNVLWEDYGLDPAHMKDLKGLMGDHSDNIPGIPGVGEKTALKLLQKYGSLEQVLAQADQISGKMGEKIRANAEQARMSYWLGTICTEAPVMLAWDQCRFEKNHMAGALEMLYRLELRAVAARLEKMSDAPSTVVQLNWEKEEITDETRLQALVQQLMAAQAVAVCLEDRLLLSDGENRQYEVALSGNLLEPGLDPQQVMEALKPVWESSRIKKLVFNAKQLMHMLAEYGMVLNGLSFDAMIADYLLNAIHPIDSLSALCKERLQLSEGSAAALFVLQRNMLAQMREKGLLELYHDVEMPLIPVLFDMEQIGFPIDDAVLLQLTAQSEQKLAELRKQAIELAGEPFNLLSPKQLGTILFEKLQLPVQKKNKRGYSTDAEVLERLADQHPIVPVILEYRFLAKMKSTFLEGLLSARRETTGRVYSCFNQNVTATGRISSTEPNLQNIPVRTELGREIRKAFIASEDHILIGADYSQIELRVLAHVSEDPTMIDIFRRGEDLHRQTAGEIFSVPPELVTDEMRSAAKAVNFGIVYGISDFGLGRNLGISRKQAGEYIERYLQRYPGVRAFMQKSVEQGKQNGYVTTLLGRRRDLPELKSSNYNMRSFGERVAMNMPIQGTAADIIKLAMVRIHALLREKGLETKLLLQVHDELIFDAPLSEQAEVAALVKNCMEQVLTLSVPLIADVKCGKRWYDTK